MIDNTEWNKGAKLVAKAPIWATRQTLAGTSALLHLPELVTTPVAYGMKTSLNKIQEAIKERNSEGINLKDSIIPEDRARLKTIKESMKSFKRDNTSEVPNTPLRINKGIIRQIGR